MQTNLLSSTQFFASKTIQVVGLLFCFSVAVAQENAALESGLTAPQSLLGIDRGQPQTTDLGIPASAIPGRVWVDGGTVIIAISDDGKQAFGYCEPHPLWAVQELEPLPGIRSVPIVGKDIAAVQHGPVCYVYSTTLGTWDTLKLPKGEKAIPVIYDDSVSIHSESLGDFVFKNAWGKWFSSADIKEGKVADYLRTRRLVQSVAENSIVTKIVQLQYCQASQAEKVVKELFVIGDKPLTLAVDERLNQLILRGDETILSEAEALLLELDRSPEKSQSEANAASASVQRGLEFLNSAKGSQDLAEIQHSAEAQPLSELRTRYAELERRCRERAALTQGKPRDTQEAEQLIESLTQAVQESFNLRQKIERAELVEFSRRLENIQQAIETRERIGQQIIKRRVQELLEPSLDWNRGIEASSLNEPREKSVRRETSVNFLLPQADFGKLQWISGPGSITSSDSRRELNTRLGSQVQFRLSELPGRRADARVFVSIEVPDHSTDKGAKILEVLAHNSIPLAFTDEDLDQTFAGNLVVKVVYRPSDLRTSGNSLFNTLVSSRLEAGVDPLSEANKLGTIVAILRMSLAPGLVTSLKDD